MVLVMVFPAPRGRSATWSSSPWSAFEDVTMVVSQGFGQSTPVICVTSDTTTAYYHVAPPRKALASAERRTVTGSETRETHANHRHPLRWAGCTEGG